MISIIIVNYRSWDHLENCLQSLTSIENTEIIVVDNCSNDGKSNSFIDNFKNVVWINSNENLGFGGACNLGAEKANGSFLLFLNPDTIANEAAILSMYHFLNSNKAYKIVSCKQHSSINKHFLLFPNAFRIFGLLRALSVFINAEKFKIKATNKVKFIEPDWVSGSVLMISRDWFANIGGWSKEFWMYSEDMDICKKTADQAGKIALLTDVQIYHKHGGATRKNLITASITKAEVIKSKHVYYQKHFDFLSKNWAHFVLIFSFIFIKFPLATIGIFLFFIPKLQMQTMIFRNILVYYKHAFKTKNWFSEKLSSR
jgi:GT2 family glycosyltransferase